jgi:cystathionine beta-lyase
MRIFIKFSAYSISIRVQFFPIVVVWTSRRIKTGLANMTKKHLDTTLVQAGRSKKYTGIGQQRDSTRLLAGV